jgi:hypothetical protein
MRYMLLLGKFRRYGCYLGMDWMTQHKVVLDISYRVVEINSPMVGHTTLYHSRMVQTLVPT